MQHLGGYVTIYGHINLESDVWGRLGGGRGGVEGTSFHIYATRCCATKNIETVKGFMFVPVNTYCYIHASLIFFLGCPFFLFQIVWVGKIYKHAKIIIYVCSTVCGGGGGGRR